VRWFRIDELPDEIGDMIQLRYLRLDCPNLLRLPSRIAELINLQTLDISNTKVEEIDQDFWKIKTLRHVLARNLTLPAATPAATAGEEGQGVPARNLRVPVPAETPAVVEHGSNLQTLHGVKPVALEKWSAENCPLRGMTNIRSLEMHGFVCATHGGPAFKSALGNMPLLGHLDLKGDEIPTCVFTDKSLQSLQTMLLHGEVNWNEMTPYELPEHRPNLIQLKLNYQANTGMDERVREQLRKILIIEF
jgi:hypothetical protein